MNIRQDVAGPPPCASFRYNNPGAQWPSSDAARFGQVGYGLLHDGNKIAHFPSPVNGAASNFDLLNHKYVGMQIGAAGKMWTGSHGFGVPGYPSDQTLTREHDRRPEAGDCVPEGDRRPGIGDRRQPDRGAVDPRPCHVPGRKCRRISRHVQRQQIADQDREQADRRSASSGQARKSDHRGHGAQELQGDPQRRRVQHCLYRRNEHGWLTEQQRGQQVQRSALCHRLQGRPTSHVREVGGYDRAGLLLRHAASDQSGWRRANRVRPVRGMARRHSPSDAGSPGAARQRHRVPRPQSRHGKEG